MDSKNMLKFTIISAILLWFFWVNCRKLNTNHSSSVHTFWTVGYGITMLTTIVGSILTIIKTSL